MATPQEVINEYIALIKNNADTYSEQFLQYSNEANEEAQNNVAFIKSIWETSNVQKVQLSGIDNFSVKNIDDFRTEFNSKYHYLISILEKTVPREFSNFINTYFPKPSNFDKLEKFLVDTALNGGIGLPPEIENQLWEKSRQRVELSTHKQIMENRKSMASRGFIVPSGVEQYSELIIRNEGNKTIAGDSSTIAIEQAKLRIEWVKVAISEARNFRSLALDATFKYLASILSIHDPALRYGSESADSFKRFYDTINSYNNSITTLNKLKLDKANLTDQFNIQYDKFWVDQLMNNESQKTNTLTQLASLMGSQASAALSGINSMVTLANTTVQEAAAA